jgi:hypothetical protein
VNATEPKWSANYRMYDYVTEVRAEMRKKEWSYHKFMFLKLLMGHMYCSFLGAAQPGCCQLPCECEQAVYLWALDGGTRRAHYCHEEPGMCHECLET